MGSHGGGTAEGQRKGCLLYYWIVCGLSDREFPLETVIEETDEGIEVVSIVPAWESDGIVFVIDQVAHHIRRGAQTA